MKGRHNDYSQAELDWLKERASMPRTELHAKFCETFGREDVTIGALKGLMKRNRWLTGRTGQFEKGQHSWNEGMTLPVSDAFRASQFKKGHRPHNQNYIGHERFNHEGYVEISVAMPNPYNSNASRHYVTKHRLLWEQLNGPVPEGHILKCLDGDKTNTEPGNWKAIPRAILPRLNGRWGNLSYDDAEPELKPFVLAAAQLQHASRTAKTDLKSGMKPFPQNGEQK